MEALLRTGLVCTVIVIVFATEAAGGLKEDEAAQSRGKWREVCSVRLTVTFSGSGDFFNQHNQYQRETLK